MSGPWEVRSIGTTWYVVNAVTGRKKAIGPFRWTGTNYRDRAHEEAERRNRAHEEAQCAAKIVKGKALRACSRAAVEDGFCTQHHPTSVKARADASESNWRERKRQGDIDRSHIYEPALHKRIYDLREALLRIENLAGAGPDDWKAEHKELIQNEALDALILDDAAPAREAQ